MRASLRRDLMRAITASDSVAISVLRSTLAAIENAEAADPADAPQPGAGQSPFAGSVRGLRAAEVGRRHLTAAEVEEIVRAEAAERLAAARDYVRLGQRERADRLRKEAAILTRRLSDPGVLTGSWAHHPHHPPLQHGPPGGLYRPAGRQNSGARSSNSMTSGGLMV